MGFVITAENKPKKNVKGVINLPHCFEVELAEKYGILEAILLNYFWHWIKKNEANNTHFHDGRYWTYNSVKAFCELFPYASTKMIRNALSKLVNEGLLMTGNYNKLPFDQTKWYAFTEYGVSEMTKGASQNCPTGEMGVAPQGKPIPVNNINTHTDEIKEIISYLNEKTGSKYRPNTDATKKHINARLDEGFAVDDFKTVIDIKTDEWLGDENMQKFLRPQTLFGTKFESYLNQPVPSKKKESKGSDMADEELLRIMSQHEGAEKW